MFLDVDECFEGSSNCTQLCVNVDGSYKCNCSSGYALNSNGKDCDGESKKRLRYKEMRYVSYDVIKSQRESEFFSFTGMIAFTALSMFTIHGFPMRCMM